MLEGIIEQLRTQAQKQLISSNMSTQNSGIRTEQTPEFRGPRGMFAEEFTILKELMKDLGVNTEMELKHKLCSYQEQIDHSQKAMKLEQNLGKLLIDTDPRNHFSETNFPRTKDIWRWVRHLCSEYMKVKSQFNSLKDTKNLSTFQFTTESFGKDRQTDDFINKLKEILSLEQESSNDEILSAVSQLV